MKFQVRSEATRQFIIESTAELFNKKGFTDTSITDLEKATGLTKGSIYGNFENKDAVAIAVFDHNLHIKMTYLQKQTDKCLTYKDKLLTHVLEHYPSAKAPFTPGGCPMQNTAIEAVNINPSLKKRAAAGLLHWSGLLVAIIESGIKEGEFKKNVKPQALALHIISLIEGGALFALATGDRKYGISLLDTAQEIIRDSCK
jgi:TetR/AcrR family transcriptional repressor of nem operon